MKILKPVVFFLPIFLALAGCTKSESDQEFRVYTIHDFLTTINYRGASFSPDNTNLLISSDSTGEYNIYNLSISTGKLTALLAEDTVSRFSISYFPEDDRILFTGDRFGNELYQLFVREVNGSVNIITPDPGHTNEFFGWSADNHAFYYKSNQRDNSVFDVVECQVTAGYPQRIIYKNDQAFEPAVISPDGKNIALLEADARDNIKLHLFNTKNGKMSELLATKSKTVRLPQAFSPDGRFLYFLTDKDHEFLYLQRLELSTGDVKTIIKTDWDVEYSYLSRTGKYLAVAFNRDARTELSVFDTESMLKTQLPSIENAEIKKVIFSNDEKHLALYASGGRTPNDLFITDLKGSPARQLTRSLSREINPDHLVDGEIVRFASWDSLEVPGILYKPKSASPDMPVPAIVLVHGGPGGQSRVGYSGLVQFLVNNGYGVFAINNRGSGGYGKTFFALDDGKHGRHDLDDCVYSKHMLAKTGWIDTNRVAIMGGSYGGYLTLAALTFRPEAFAAGINLFGVSNWVRTVKSFPPYWKSYMKALESEFGTFDDEDYLRSISPLFHAKNIVRPLMVIQGANDQRVLQVEADEIVEAARSKGIPVEYLLFDDEGHGLIRKENQVVAFEGILRFLDTYVKRPVEIQN